MVGLGCSFLPLLHLHPSPLGCDRSSDPSRAEYCVSVHSLSFLFPPHRIIKFKTEPHTRLPQDVYAKVGTPEDHEP